MNLRVLGAAAALVISSFTSAEELTGFYGDIGVGTNTLSIYDFDSSSRSFNIGMGYQLNSYVALEASYIDFGEKSEVEEYSFSDSEISIRGSSISKLGAKGLKVGAKFSWPVTDNWSADLRVGLSRVDLDWKASVSQLTVHSNWTDSYTEEFSESYGENNPYLGIGVSYSFDSARVSLDVSEYQHFDDVTLQNTSLNFQYFF